MKKPLPLYFLFTLFSIQTFSATKYWVGGAAGNYSTGTNWNTQPDGSGNFEAPVNTDNIIIRTNAVITIDGNYLPSSLWIENNAAVTFTATAARNYIIGGGTVSPAFKIASGATLNITGPAAIVLTMNFSNCEIYGTLDFSGSNSKMNYENGIGSGTTTVKSGGKIRYGGNSANGTGSLTTFFMEAGSIYEIYKNAGIFPAGNYNSNSLILNTGAVTSAATFAMNSAAGSYGNYEFASPAYTNASTGINQNITFNNFTLTDDGSGRWVFSTSPNVSYNLTINGNLFIETGTAIGINQAGYGSQSTTISIKGNLNNRGQFTETGLNIGSTIELCGNSSSTIKTVSNGFANDVSLKINKSAGTVIAISDINLPNSTNAKLILSNGNVDMKSNNKILFIQNPSSNALVSGSVASHIIGKLTRSANQAASAYEFPVSDNESEFAKAVITTINSNPTDWTIDFLKPNTNNNTGLIPGTIDEVSNYYWNVSRTGTGDIGILSLYYNEITNPGINIGSQLNIIRWNATQWESLGGLDAAGSIDNTLGTTGGDAPTDPISSFGQFALGGTLNTLPLSFYYFTASKKENTNYLSWKNNCSNNTGINFIVEKSKDGLGFNEISSIYAPSLTCNNEFNYIDKNPFNGLNYYRIKMKDLNNKISFSKINVIDNTSQQVFTINNIYPNPATGDKVYLNVSSNCNQDLQLYIIDMSGKFVRKDKFELMKGITNVAIDVTLLPKGSYQLITADKKGDINTIGFIR